VSLLDLDNVVGGRATEVVRAFEAEPDGLDIIAGGGPRPEDGDGVPGETPSRHAA